MGRAYDVNIDDIIKERFVEKLMSLHRNIFYSDKEKFMTVEECKSHILQIEDYKTRVNMLIRLSDIDEEVLLDVISDDDFITTIFLFNNKDKYRYLRRYSKEILTMVEDYGYDNMLNQEFIAGICVDTVYDKIEDEFILDTEDGRVLSTSVEDKNKVFVYNDICRKYLNRDIDDTIHYLASIA
jgi:hypothetical protein